MGSLSVRSIGVVSAVLGCCELEGLEMVLEGKLTVRVEGDSCTSGICAFAHCIRVLKFRTKE